MKKQELELELNELESLLIDMMEDLGPDSDIYYEIDGILQDMNWIDDYEGDEWINEAMNIIESSQAILGSL